MTRKAYSYIRMSTETQLRGDSLTRQLNASQNYALQNDLELITEIGGVNLNDIGVSAFYGENKKTGALAVFLSALERGEIEQNSVLLIESFDRLSRENTLDSFPLFTMILKKGIEIVTLVDNQKYTHEIAIKSPFSLMMSFSSMIRANEESQIKSTRIKSAWANKRINGYNNKVLTKICPGWLKYSEENKKFEVISDRSKVVKKIFDLCINSCGYNGIAKYLNQNKVPLFGNSKIWYASYVKKIIENRSVLGEFQPHHYEDSKRLKVGNPIPNYFPKIISEQNFYLAHAAVNNRKLVGGGNKGKNFTNLFTGLLYCGSCNFTMRLRSRGGKSPSSRYLVCENQFHGAGCKMHEWNLVEFQNSIFKHLSEINFAELTNNSESYISNDLELKITASKEKLKHIEAQFNAAIESTIQPNLLKEVKQAYEQKANELYGQKLSCQKELDKYHLEFEARKQTQNLINDSSLKNLISKLKTHEDDYFFRSSLNQYLAKTIDKIVLVEPENYLRQWEIDENDNVIRAFRASFKRRANLSHAQLINHPNFEQFNRNFNRQIHISYVTGAKKIVYYGDDFAFSNHHEINKMLESYQPK